MHKKILNPDSVPTPRGFNHGILVDGGSLLFLAGQDGSDADDEIVAPDDLVAQFDQVLSNHQAIVDAAGGTMDDVVKFTTFVADRDEYLANLDPLGDVFSSYFTDYPTMSLFEVSEFFRDDALIELEGIAVVDTDS